MASSMPRDENEDPDECIPIAEILRRNDNQLAKQIRALKAELFDTVVVAIFISHSTCLLSLHECSVFKLHDSKIH